MLLLCDGLMLPALQFFQVSHILKRKVGVYFTLNGKLSGPKTHESLLDTDFVDQLLESEYFSMNFLTVSSLAVPPLAPLIVIDLFAAPIANSAASFIFHFLESP